MDNTNIMRSYYIMNLRAVFALLGIFAASPAQACMIMSDTPSNQDLRDLQILSNNIEKQTEIKSHIDASVWGVFLDPPSDSLKKGYARFKVGGVSKGQLSEIIHLVSMRRDVILGTEIHKLNLRKIDKSRWTDVGVTQQELNWEEEACKTSQNSQSCKIHLAKNEPFKKLCEAFLIEVYTGCFNPRSLPKPCLQYAEDFDWK